MPCRLVLDTNVVLDLFHFADAAALPILTALEEGRAECLATAEMLDELARVLTYPELKIEADAAVSIRQRYQALCRCVEPPAPVVGLPRCRDADDQKFLELAARIGADYLISKDRALLELARTPGLGFAILSPAAAAARLA